MFFHTASMVPALACLLAGLRGVPPVSLPHQALESREEPSDAVPDDVSLFGYAEGRHPGGGNPVPVPSRPRGLDAVEVIPPFEEGVFADASHASGSVVAVPAPAPAAGAEDAPGGFSPGVEVGSPAEHPEAPRRGAAFRLAEDANPTKGGP